MDNGELPRHPLTNDEKTLLSDEETKIQAKITKIYEDLNTDEEGFPEHVQNVKKMIFPE